ncbi:MAG: hypothetical protein ACK4WH_13860 [Phycisphaerales bacterium]
MGTHQRQPGAGSRRGVGQRTRAVIGPAILLGALTTAAVSFAIAYWPPLDRTVREQDFIVLGGRRHSFSITRSFGLCTTSWHEEDRDTRFVPAIKGRSVVQEGTSRPERWSSIWSSDQRAQTAAAIAQGTSWGCTDVRAGWPFMAFGGTTFKGGATLEWHRDGDVLFPPVRRWTSGPRAGRGQVMSIPLRPLPLGLTLNTFIFAVPWYVVLTAAGKLRRARRTRRGLCPRCAYDLRATPVESPCPECGRARAR